MKDQSFPTNRSRRDFYDSLSCLENVARQAFLNQRVFVFFVELSLRRDSDGGSNYTVQGPVNCRKIQQRQEYFGGMLNDLPLGESFRFLFPELLIFIRGFGESFRQLMLVRGAD